jgi:hypothetical protein
MLVTRQVRGKVVVSMYHGFAVYGNAPDRWKQSLNFFPEHPGFVIGIYWLSIIALVFNVVLNILGSECGTKCLEANLDLCDVAGEGYIEE